MPQKPPTAGRIREQKVVRMAADEVTAAAAVRSAVSRSKARLRKVDLDEAPARAKSPSRATRDEEEPIRGQSDGSMEGSAISWWRRNGRFGRRANRSGTHRCH